MNYKIEAEIAPTIDRLIQAIAGFSDDDFNVVPFEGSWTAGQVAEHLRLATGNLTGLFYGNTTVTERNPEAKIQQTADLFLNFETKLVSPDFIDPKMMRYEKDAMIRFFTDTKAKMLQAAAELDLSMTCEDFGLPVFGKLTRVEWIAFVIYHIQRHTLQLKKIAAAL